MMKRFAAVLLCLAVLCLGAAAAETKVGSVVSFGRYEQDNDTKNGPEEILWWVIDTQGDSALLLSGYGLDLRPFDGKTWDRCGLRTWLNGTFYNTAFSDEEKERIYQTMVRTPGNSAYDKPAAADTTDRVFVLSMEEFDHLLTNWGRSKMARTQATPYAQSKTKEKYLTSWWLRTPGSHRGNTFMTCSFENRNKLGNFDDDKNTMVRPSIWVNMKTEAAD